MAFDAFLFTKVTNLHINFTQSYLQDTKNKPWPDQLKNELITRISAVVFSVFYLIAGTLDIAIGLPAAAASFLIGGTHPALFKFAICQLNVSNSLFSYFFSGLLVAVNPRYNKSERVPSSGFFAEPVGKAVLKKICEAATSKKAFEREFIARIITIPSAIAVPAARLADITLSLAAAPLSLLTLGTSRRLNDCAFRTLQAAGLIADLFLCTSVFVNPQVIHHLGLSADGKEPLPAIQQAVGTENGAANGA